MRVRYLAAGIIGLLITGIQSAIASSINYAVSNITGNTWEYTYTVNNDTLGFDISEFTVFFDSGDYKNLSLVAVPTISDWAPIVVQPDNIFSNDGYYDAINLANGITPDNSLGGFSVRFEFLGVGTPGSQSFDIVNPDNYSISFDSGLTSLVPIPPAVWLFSSGLIGLIGIAKKKKS